MYQCAEMHRMALGRGRLAPIVAHVSVYWLRDRAFIGLPCPKKMAGIRDGYLLCASSIFDLLPMVTARVAFPSITVQRNQQTKVRADEPNWPEFIKADID